MEELSSLLRARGAGATQSPDSSLGELGFRSIDFAALALRVEERAGRELDLSAGDLTHGLASVKDLLTFFRAAVGP